MSSVSADEVGPPGMLFVALQGVQFPVDAVWVKPALVKQLERKQVSSSFFLPRLAASWSAHIAYACCGSAG